MVIPNVIPNIPVVSSGGSMSGSSLAGSPGSGVNIAGIKITGASIRPYSSGQYSNVDPAQLGKLMQSQSFIGSQTGSQLAGMQERLGTRTWPRQVRDVYNSIRKGATTPIAIGSMTGLDDTEISSALSFLSDAGYINLSQAVGD